MPELFVDRERLPDDERPCPRSQNISRFVSRLGERLVSVPVSGADSSVILDEADWDRLVSLGLADGTWYVNRARNRPYVRVRHGNRSVVIAMALCSLIKPASMVRYANGNGLDLRRCNLIASYKSRKGRNV